MKISPPTLNRTNNSIHFFTAMAITISFPISITTNRHHFSAANNHHYHFHRFSNHSLFNNLSSNNSPSPTLQTNHFPTNKNLDNYNYHQELESGFLWIRAMKEEEMDMTVRLLSDSFAESMMISSSYVKFLEFLVRNYLVERREKLPHNVTLIGVYRENGEEDFELAGTVELTFDQFGANANPPTPLPPRNAPYVCNMAVLKSLRRRGIGWHLLKAGEELITKMSSEREVYLHCRIIDEGPLNMYKKAGYSIVQTDSILTLLTLQRRKHLMCKCLPMSENHSETNIPNEELS